MSKLDYTKERLKNFLPIPSQNRLLYLLLSLGALCFTMGFTIGRLTKSASKPIVKIDTVRIEKPIQLGGTLTDNSVIIGDEADEDPVKPIPALTKYKVTDWVCAWGKWSGVVREVHWSERNPDVLVYEVQHYSETDGEWYENPYYETELEAGKCN